MPNSQDMITPVTNTDVSGPEVPGPSSPYPVQNSHVDGENGWQYFWRELWDRMNNYFNQSQVGTNAEAEYAIGKANGEITDTEAIGQIFDAMSNNVSPSSGTSAVSAGQYSMDSLLGNSAFQASDALQGYYDLYQKTGNQAYLQKLYDSLFSLEATQSARDWDKMMSDTQFSRMVADIEKAGYNPWMALQSGGASGASYSGVSSAKGSTSIAENVAVSEANSRRSTNAELTTSIIRVLGIIALMSLRAI